MEKTYKDGLYEGRMQVIVYLLGVAEKTEGAEVWRALLSEAMRAEQLQHGEYNA